MRTFHQRSGRTATDRPLGRPIALALALKAAALLALYAAFFAAPPAPIAAATAVFGLVR